MLSPRRVAAAGGRCRPKNDGYAVATVDRAPMLATVHLSAMAHTYYHQDGYIGRGGDVLPPRAIKLADAEKLCSQTPDCNAITFESSEKAPTGTIPKLYFKKSTYLFGDAAWQTYLRDYVPPPPMLINPCLNASLPYRRQPWCDASRRLSERVDDMLSRGDLVCIDRKSATLVAAACVRPLPRHLPEPDFIPHRPHGGRRAGGAPRPGASRRRRGGRWWHSRRWRHAGKSRARR